MTKYFFILLKAFHKAYLHLSKNSYNLFKGTLIYVFDFKGQKQQGIAFSLLLKGLTFQYLILMAPRNPHVFIISFS